jgi:hypothetical protein
MLATFFVRFPFDIHFEAVKKISTGYFTLHICITTTCTSIRTEILDTVCHLRVKKKIQHFGRCTCLHVEAEQGQRGFYSGEPIRKSQSQSLDQFPPFYLQFSPFHLKKEVDLASEMLWAFFLTQ